MKPTCRALLALLQRHPGEWISHAICYEAGGHRTTARVMELRQMGYTVEQEGVGENSRYRLIGGPPARTVENAYPRLICACGFAGPSVLFNKFFDECLCPKCGKSVGQERLAV